MPEAMSADAVLNREFLEIRAKILELAASLDRIQRGSGAQTVKSDSRYALIEQGLQILHETEEGRAERVQLLFSLPFERDWRKQFAI